LVIYDFSKTFPAVENMKIILGILVELMFCFAFIAGGVFLALLF
jgi:hypothetical protein